MIKRDDFLKLSQLSRVEYLLKLQQIENKTVSGFLLYFIDTLFYKFLPIILLVSILYYQINGLTDLQIFLNKLIIPVGIVIGLFIVIAMLFDLFFISIRKQKLDELKSEFFKVEVKPKK